MVSPPLLGSPIGSVDHKLIVFWVVRVRAGRRRNGCIVKFRFDMGCSLVVSYLGCQGLGGCISFLSITLPQTSFSFTIVKARSFLANCSQRNTFNTQYPGRHHNGRSQAFHARVRHALLFSMVVFALVYLSSCCYFLLYPNVIRWIFRSAKNYTSAIAPCSSEVFGPTKVRSREHLSLNTAILSDEFGFEVYICHNDILPVVMSGTSTPPLNRHLPPLFLAERWLCPGFFLVGM